MMHGTMKLKNPTSTSMDTTVLSMEVKQPECGDHAPPSSIELANECRNTSLPLCAIYRTILTLQIIINKPLISEIYQFLP
jgi:hypothetical protein